MRIRVVLGALEAKRLECIHDDSRFQTTQIDNGMARNHPSAKGPQFFNAVMVLFQIGLWQRLPPVAQRNGN
jgi:hypothetical protein